MCSKIVLNEANVNPSLSPFPSVSRRLPTLPGSLQNPVDSFQLLVKSVNFHGFSS